MNAIIFLAVMVCSAIDVGRQGTQHEFHYEKWWIYLSHWTLLACTVQGWLAALICTKALMDNNRDFGKWAGLFNIIVICISIVLGILNVI